MTDLLNDLSGLATLGDTRRTALRRAGQIGLGAALAAIPFVKPGRAQAQSSDGDFGILNYALTLEYLERSFYRQAEATGLIASADAPLFDTIREDEEQHVTLLAGAITAAGGTPVVYTDADFTFDPFLDSYDTIKVLAQGLEDTGVRAYKGQAAAIMDRERAGGYLTVALQIHSVEARHAAAIRRLNGNQGWIPGSQPNAPAPIAPVYAGEDNVTQGGVNLSTALMGYTSDDITEAFDEPLTMDQVLAIAGQFITGEEGDED